MPEMDRRSVMVLGALLPFASALTGGGTAFAAEASAPKGGAQWDLSDLYPDLTAWQAARADVLAALPRLKQWQGRLGESAATMLAALEDVSSVSRIAERVYVYAALKADEDQRISQEQEREAQARDMYTALMEAVAWQAPEVLALGKDKVESFIAAEPKLAHRFAFGLRDTLRNAEHVLDAKGEAILAASSSPLAGPGDIRTQLVSSDIPWPTVTLSDGRSQRLDGTGYALTRDAPNREDRKKVFDTFWSANAAYSNSIGASLASKISGDVFRSKARGYPSTLAMGLSGSNVPENVYRTLIAEANTGLPQLHRYFELRRRMLKLPDLHYYDIYPPLVTLERRFTLDDMRAITLAATKPLGPQYSAHLAKGTTSRWMDPFPRTGKQGGAYMNGGAYDVHPYLLLNLGENYEGLTTYAHEWGHAVHSMLANEAQPYELASYPTFTAEIASTCNEVLLFEFMLGRAQTRQEKIFYLGQRLEQLRGTFFRQTMFAEFELKIHELAEAGEGLSGRRFTETYLDLLKRYHGPGVTIDPAYAVEWAFVHHFWAYSYYVYQYATSIAAGTTFARRILRGGKAERENYLNVLRAGGSDYPVDLLKRAGLDMTTSEPYRELVDDFAETMDRIEQLL